MNYRVRVPKPVQKQLDKIPQSTRARVLERILSLRENPRPMGSIKLKNSERELGDVKLFENKRDGFAPRLQFTSPDYAQATRRLNLECDIGLGDADVQYGI